MTSFVHELSLVYKIVGEKLTVYTALDPDVTILVPDRTISSVEVAGVRLIYTQSRQNRRI